MLTSDRKFSISVFFPFYNEQENIRSAVETAVKILESIKKVSKFEIIIVDDGSKDKTKEIAKDLAKKYSNVKIVSHLKNLGYGNALTSGIHSCSYDYIFFTDGDLQFDFKEIEKFLEYVPEYKVIIGYRSPRRDPLMRILNGLGWNMLNRIFFGLKVKDVDCAFKLFKKEVIVDLPIISGGAMVSAEILVRLKDKSIKFKEIPVSHFPRKKGSPTGAKMRVIFRAFKEFFNFYLRYKKRNLSEFLKYFVVGCSGFVLDIGTLFVFKNFIGLSAVLAVVINQLIICNYIFFLNKFWVFANKNQVTKQIIKYYILALFNYAVAIVWMWFFHNVLGQNYLLVRICNIALSVAWNFLLYKFFIYI